MRDAYATSPLFNVSQTYDYDPTGNPLVTPTQGPLTDFRYAGMFYHPDSGLYLTEHRAYDPRTGRWLTRDPLGEISDPAANLYRYTQGDPVNLVDPMGLSTGGMEYSYAPPPAGFWSPGDPFPPSPGDSGSPCPPGDRAGPAPTIFRGAGDASPSAADDGDFTSSDALGGNWAYGTGATVQLAASYFETFGLPYLSGHVIERMNTLGISPAQLNGALSGSPVPGVSPGTIHFVGPGATVVVDEDGVIVTIYP